MRDYRVTTVFSELLPTSWRYGVFKGVELLYAVRWSRFAIGGAVEFENLAFYHSRF